jgi:hypothetical protein
MTQPLEISFEFNYSLSLTVSFLLFHPQHPKNAFFEIIFCKTILHAEKNVVGVN